MLDFIPSNGEGSELSLNSHIKLFLEAGIALETYIDLSDL